MIMFNNKQSGQFLSCIYVNINNNNNNKQKKYGLLSVFKSYKHFQDSMDQKIRTTGPKQSSTHPTFEQPHSKYLNIIYNST